ncbi:hypothetical protein AVEN_89756-1 [Araneus ventricosus]|uniref:Uncharacterized protein n=1 Tax=Araneus ventricosus TaxID=182803 RepID=A0A4Y2ISN6_ARAVE|nr:hypothetical protein AVEN_89756-1 [Araneus ventricosus]
MEKNMAGESRTVSRNLNLLSQLPALSADYVAEVLGAIDREASSRTVPSNLNFLSKLPVLSADYVAEVLGAIDREASKRMESTTEDTRYKPNDLNRIYPNIEQPNPDQDRFRRLLLNSRMCAVNSIDSNDKRNAISATKRKRGGNVSNKDDIKENAYNRILKNLKVTEKYKKWKKEPNVGRRFITDIPINSQKKSINSNATAPSSVASDLMRTPRGEANFECRPPTNVPINGRTINRHSNTTAPSSVASDLMRRPQGEANFEGRPPTNVPINGRTINRHSNTTAPTSVASDLMRRPRGEANVEDRVLTGVPINSWQIYRNSNKTAFSSVALDLSLPNPVIEPENLVSDELWNEFKTGLLE